MTRLYIARHGETDYNLNGRYQGHTELPLNATGRRQSEQLGARLAGLKLDVIYTSDLPRARETARAIAHGRTVALDPRLREVNVGRVAGLTDEEITRREPAFREAFLRDPDGTPYPCGESAYDVQRRTLEVFDAICRRYPDVGVGVVTHGGLIKLIVAHVLGLSLPDRHRTAFDNCGLTIIDWDGAHGRVLAMNDTGHLTLAPTAAKAY